MKDSPLVQYLLSLEKKGMLFGLENISSILFALGNPHLSYRSVHVGGTNGKGSVTKVLSSLLVKEGYRTGRYTSPHLHSITERFSINEEDIKYEEFVKICEEIWQRIIDEKISTSFTFFDFTTAVAFEYFRRESVEIAVVEVGLGGRLDSTNVIKPLLSVITNVSYDHMDYLGSTISSIAQEKAGIIKENVPVITGAKGVALRILEDFASRKRSPLYVLGKHFSFEKIKERMMDYRGIKWNFHDLYVNLLGDHQLSNVSLALCALEILSENGFPVKESTIREGLSNIEWMGRLEIVKERPKIILDGAHNTSGMRALTKYISENLKGRRIVCIFGVMKDKDFKGMAKLVLSWAEKLIITKPSLDRALDVKELKKLLPFAYPADSVREALENAKKEVGEDDVIVVTGSLFLVAEARALIHEIF